MADNYWINKEVLITGGTGSLGQTLTRLLYELNPRGIRIYSRDEAKQSKMRAELEAEGITTKIAFNVGDVRDLERLKIGLQNVDVVFHCAALKQVPACEENPTEAVATNIKGAENVLTAALECGVDKVLNISTDKAASPITLYGGTKFVAERIFNGGNNYSPRGGVNNPKFSSTRWGNVAASTGSIIPVFREQIKQGRITITHPEMTRYWITKNDAAKFAIRCAEIMNGREVFIPKMPSFRVIDLIKAMTDIEPTIIGIRPGEKLHEDMINEDDIRNLHYLMDDTGIFVIGNPPINAFDGDVKVSMKTDINDQWLSVDSLRELIREMV